MEVIPVKDLLALGRQADWTGVRLRRLSVFDRPGDRRAGALGVFSCYRPVAADTPVPENQKQLSAKDWAELYTLARTDKKKAFERYSEYYLRTSGQVYWSDTHQLAGNFDGYREAVDKAARHGDDHRGLRVQGCLRAVLAQAARTSSTQVDMTYGTIRFIEKDAESFLAWAREPSVCIVCNLHVMHTERRRREGGRGLSPDHRPSHRVRRQVLPDLSPLGRREAGRDLLSAVRRVSAAEEEVRSAGALSERLVSPLQVAVRRQALMSDRGRPLLADQRIVLEPRESNASISSGSASSTRV